MSEIQNVAALEAAVAAQKKQQEEAEKKQQLVGAAEKQQGSEDDPYADMDTYEIAYRIGTGEITDPGAIAVYLDKQHAWERQIVEAALTKEPDQRPFLERKLARIDATYDFIREGGAPAHARYCAEQGAALGTSSYHQARIESTNWFAMAGRLSFSELVPPAATPTPTESAPVAVAPIPEPAPAPSVAGE